MEVDITNNCIHICMYTRVLAPYLILTFLHLFFFFFWGKQNYVAENGVVFIFILSSRPQSGTGAFGSISRVFDFHEVHGPFVS
jgi:hypothetical protein